MSIQFLQRAILTIVETLALVQIQIYSEQEIYILLAALNIGITSSLFIHQLKGTKINYLIRSIFYMTGSLLFLYQKNFNVIEDLSGNNLQIASLVYLFFFIEFMLIAWSCFMQWCQRDSESLDEQVSSSNHFGFRALLQLINSIFHMSMAILSVQTGVQIQWSHQHTVMGLIVSLIKALSLMKQNQEALSKDVPSFNKTTIHMKIKDEIKVNLLKEKKRNFKIKNTGKSEYNPKMEDGKDKATYMKNYLN